MKKIHIITASAGSGKTYRLAELMEQRISSGRVRPEALIATTFTRKAAAELQERVRQRLIQQNRSTEANRLQAARMGTINAICAKLVMAFAFEEGVYPDVGVLDEEAAHRELRRAISRIITPEQTRRMTALEDLFPGYDGLGAVGSIIDLARNNGLDHTGIMASKSYSLHELQGILGPSISKTRNLDAELKARLEIFVQEVDLENDTTGKTKGSLDFCQSILNHLQQDRRLKWSDWLKLSRLDVGKKSLELASGVISVAETHDSHPALKQDMQDAISLVFDIAARALTAYQDHKREWGMMDFSDQEMLALELLQKPDVIRQLTGGIDLLLVDEFQDTSPIQLAILLKLADISKETVWVGDPKQSIFGFRGTDPILMDACVQQILKTGSIETLNTSWRSRPPLVQVTSDLFSTAFACHGIPEKWVRLTPARSNDPLKKSPAVEWWTLQSKNKDNDAAALARGVRDVLNDPDIHVRAGTEGQTRKARAGDIAILCRTNDFCETVAAALADINIPAAIPRSGLVSTPEIMAVMAGLRIWVNPEDSLASAELARIFHYYDDPATWLEKILEQPGMAAFSDLDHISRLIALARQYPFAGVMESLSRVSRILNIREWCLAWGNSADRLANLDCLTSHAAAYVDTCALEGIGCTPAGFVAHMNNLNAEGGDTLGDTGGEDAVTVITWHRAKGLEWPITILGQIGKTFDPNPLGVHVIHDWQTFDIQAPLKNRCLRYWITPYHPRTRYSLFHDRLNAHPTMADITRSQERQDLRLLYVGWTRARDRLILAGRDKEFASGILGILQDRDQSPLLTAPVKQKTCWAGSPVSLRVRELEPAEPEPKKRVPGRDYAPVPPVTHPPARCSPSNLTGQVDTTADKRPAVSMEKIGDRIQLGTPPDMTLLGEAIHTFFAADRSGFDPTHRLTLAKDILTRWQVPKSLDPKSLVTAADTLKLWLDHQYPDADWQREMPVFHRLDNGTLISGFIDLLLETKEAWVVVDHKAFPGNRDEMMKKAVEYSGQLDAYAQALEKIRLKPVVRVVHFVVSGWLIMFRY